MQPFNVDSDGQGDILFPNCAKKSRKMDNPVDAVSHDCFLKTFKVQNVSKDVWTLINNLLAWFDDVRKDDIFLTVLSRWRTEFFFGVSRFQILFPYPLAF